MPTAPPRYGQTSKPKLPMYAQDKRIRGSAGMKMRARRRAIYPLCELCEKQGHTKLTDVIDHRLPLALGGKDVDENCRGLCHAHHVEVTAEQFAGKR